MLGLASEIRTRVPASQVVEGVVTVAPSSGQGVATARTPFGFVSFVAPELSTFTVGKPVRLARVGGAWTFLHLVYSGGVSLPSYQPQLTNPAFEESTLVGWTQFGDTPSFTRSTDTPRAGTASGAVAASQGPFTTMIANDPIQAIPGTYQAGASFGYRETSPDTGTVSLEAWTAPSLEGCRLGGAGLHREVVATQTDDLWPGSVVTGMFTVPGSRRVLRLVFVYTVTVSLANTMLIDSLSLSHTA